MRTFRLHHLAWATWLPIMLAGCGGGDDGPTGPGPDGTGGIAAARAAADGAVSLPITGVKVTYLKPPVGDSVADPAGFTVQLAQTGPALFIAVDPASLAPAPAVGDVVSFTILQMGTALSQRRALDIGSYSRVSTGGSVDSLAQDVSAATDLVSAVEQYDAELVTLTGTISSAFTAAGTGFVRASLSTAGIPADPSLQLRVPSALADTLGLEQGCTVTAFRVPLGRASTAAQVGAFRSNELSLSGCPGPTVTSAVATSGTSVEVTFSRPLDFVSVLSDGSQFTFDNGLTATAAIVDGVVVTVTTTAQAPGTVYTVTAGGGLLDTYGNPVGIPNSAQFSGMVTPAVLRINEFNANITGGCDLIELRVVAGGSTLGMRIRERTGDSLAGELDYALPTIAVEANDFIVVHLNSSSATCNPGAATQETAAKNEQPVATFAGNYDTAFDLWAADAGLTSTDNVVTLIGDDGGIADAVFASDDPAGVSTSSATETAAAMVGAAGAWSPALATYIDTVFRVNAVSDLDATGTTATGNSIQRLDDTDDDDKGDWTSGGGAASTFGALNAGQSVFAAPPVSMIRSRASTPAGVRASAGPAPYTAGTPPRSAPRGTAPHGGSPPPA